MIVPDIKARAEVLCGALGLRMVGTIQGTEPMDTEQLRLSLLASGETPEVVAEIVQQISDREAEKALRWRSIQGGL